MLITWVIVKQSSIVTVVGCDATCPFKIITDINTHIKLTK